MVDKVDTTFVFDLTRQECQLVVDEIHLVQDYVDFVLGESLTTRCMVCILS